MTSPLLSVVMPVHNGEPWIAAALDSLCRQDGRDFECLVIDSSPTDASLEIVQRYSNRLNLRIDRRPDVLRWTEKNQSRCKRSARPIHLHVASGRHMGARSPRAGPALDR